MDSRRAGCTLYKKKNCTVHNLKSPLPYCLSLQTYYGFSKGTLGQTSLFGLAAAEFWSSFQSTADHGKARTRHSKIESNDTDTATKTSSAVSHFIPQNQWYLNFAKTNQITGIEFLTSSKIFYC